MQHRPGRPEYRDPHRSRTIGRSVHVRNDEVALDPTEGLPLRQADHGTRPAARRLRGRDDGWPARTVDPVTIDLKLRFHEGQPALHVVEHSLVSRTVTRIVGHSRQPVHPEFRRAGLERIEAGRRDPEGRRLDAAFERQWFHLVAPIPGQAGSAPVYRHCTTVGVIRLPREITLPCVLNATMLLPVPPPTMSPDVVTASHSLKKTSP
jgi:hypothetical protein